MSVFGRFDVYFPDGRVQTYALDGDTVSVGRAEGNTISLDTDTISRYHFSVTHRDGIVQLTDLESANGTYIDGTQLKSNDPYPLNDVEEIQIGHLRIIYHPNSDGPTMPISTMDDSTQPSDFGFRVSLEMTHVDVWPASSSSVEIAVTNSTTDEGQYQIAVTGLPDGWAKVNRPIMLIDGLDTTYVLLNIKPSRRADIAPADYPVEIRVSTMDAPEKFIQVDLMVSVKGFGGFGVALSPETISGDEDFHLYMLNQGNESITLSVEGYDRTNQVQFEVPAGNVQLSAGQRTQVTGQVQPQNRPLIGKPIDIPFAIVVKAHTNSQYMAAVPGTLRVEPSLSNWMLATVSGILSAIVLVLIVLLTQTPEPEIQSFSLASAQVEQGTAVELSWSAQNVQSFVIEVNRVAIGELTGDVTSYLLETTDYTTPVDVALIAINGDLTDIETRTLDVYQPVTVNLFETDRLEMIRNVSGTLSVRWNVSGSVVTNVNLPIGFDSLTAVGLDGPSGETVIAGAPSGDFEIALSAQDSIGNFSQSSIAITTLDPECTPTQDVLLFEGPDSLFTQTAEAVADVPVIVDGLDPSRQWIQVELASGEVAWGFKASFVCEGFDSSQLIVIDDVPVLPTLTPTLPSTPTNIPTETPTASSTPLPSNTPTVVRVTSPPATSIPTDIPPTKNSLYQALFGQN